MTHDEAMAFIHNVNWIGSKPGLERTYELLDKLGNPHKKLKFIHVAGTNGKGSACSMMASILETAGYKVGLYTSPYIHRFNERMQINGQMISDEELTELCEHMKPVAESMKDVPTEFEIITALAMEYFERNHCDIVVLEVGMGGAMDSTNVIDCPELAVIMSIGLDHTAFLGNTIAEIAETKAGIVKEGGRVVVYGRDPEAEAVFRRICEERHAEYYIPDYESLNPVMNELDGQIFDFGGFRNLKIPLAGMYQLYNASVVIKAMSVLNKLDNWYVSDEAIREGLRKTRWTGRFEILSKNPMVIVDGSHNPHGIAATAESIRNYFQGTKLVVIMGVMADKDVENILPTMMPLAEEFITVTPDNPRSMKAEELARRLNASGAKATPAATIEEGCQMALDHAKMRKPVISIGSLYMVGDVTRAMKKLLKTGTILS